jgi:hypothetical protein
LKELSSSEEEFTQPALDTYAGRAEFKNKIAGLRLEKTSLSTPSV